jgi:hypothetical protein
MARAARAMAMAMRVAGNEEGNGKGARAIATAMRMASNKEGDDKDGKSDGNGNEGGGQQRG